MTDFVITALGRQSSDFLPLQEFLQARAQIDHQTDFTVSDTRCQHIYIRLTGQAADFKTELFQQGFQWPLDLAWQPREIFEQRKKLLVMDMDSTLIRQEVIDEIADLLGLKKEVSEITEAAMQGKLDFRQSLTRRVALLKGLSVNRLPEVGQRLELNEGAQRLIGFLKAMGVKTALVSGGFNYFTQPMAKRVGFDFAFANQLETNDDHLTGQLVGEIVDRQKKEALLRSLASQENLALSETVAVGDGANDLGMLSAAGLGVAFHAKPAVREQSSCFIQKGNLSAIAFFMGFSEQELQQL